MKKHAAGLLMGTACVLLAFVIGLSVGKGQRSPLTVTQTSRVSTSATETFSLLVNINTASLEELSVLPGIGEAYAGNIIRYREENGYFETVEALLNVEGIGPARLEAILDYITTGGTQ